MAEIALYLSRDESKCVSGLNNVVDGGYSITNGSFTMQSKISFRKSKFVPKSNCPIIVPSRAIQHGSMRIH